MLGCGLRRGKGRGVWGHAADGGMRAKAVIIVGAPMLDQESGLGEGGKPVLVKAVVAESAIEAFKRSVLHGVPWSGCDEG